MYTKEELDIFTTAALDSECLKMSSEEEALDEREFWSNAIQDGNEDILLAILLPLLPNLATFTVEATARRHASYNLAVEQAASATKPTLCKLAHIRLNPCSQGGFDLAEIQRFSALPSVRILTAPRAYGTGIFPNLSPDTTSNVTHLKLWGSRINSKALDEFPRGFPELQSFTYSYSPSYEASHDAFLIRISLLAHCKATLQDLTLLAPEYMHTSFMGSLRDFEKLRQVYTEWSCLILEVPNSGGRRLNEHLPAPLVRLKIHDGEGREKSEYEKVIKSAQYAKEHRLQKLKWLTFGGTRVRWSLETIDGGLKKTCKNMGITLIFSPCAPKSGD